MVAEECLCVKGRGVSGGPVPQDARRTDPSREWPPLRSLRGLHHSSFWASSSQAELKFAPFDFQSGLQKGAELLRREAGGLGNSAHGQGVDRSMARNREANASLAHDDVLALPRDPKSDLLEDTHGLLLADAGNLWHSLGGGLESHQFFADGFHAFLFRGYGQPFGD